MKALRIEIIPLHNVQLMADWKPLNAKHTYT